MFVAYDIVTIQPIIKCSDKVKIYTNLLNLSGSAIKLNKKPNYTVEPIPANYPIRGALDISKAQYELKYEPKFDLSEGLDDTISKYK